MGNHYPRCRNFDMAYGEIPPRPQGAGQSRFNNSLIRQIELTEATEQWMGGDVTAIASFLTRSFELHNNRTPLQMAECGFADYESAMRLLQKQPRPRPH